MDIKKSLEQMVIKKIFESLFSGDKHYRVRGFIKGDNGEETPVANKIFNVRDANEAKLASIHLHSLSRGAYRVDSAHELSEDESDLTEGFFTREKPVKYSREEIKTAYDSFASNKAKTVNALKARVLDSFNTKHKGNINSPDYDQDLNRLHWHVYRNLDKHMANTFTPNEVEMLHGLHENTIVDHIYKNQDKPEYDKLIQKIKKYKPLSSTPTTS